MGRPPSYIGVVIECPGATAARKRVIASDARTCAIYGWVRGDRTDQRLSAVVVADHGSSSLEEPRRLTRGPIAVLLIGLTVSVAVALWTRGV